MQDNAFGFKKYDWYSDVARATTFDGTGYHPRIWRFGTSAGYY
jgi:hypothetical protein